MFPDFADELLPFGYDWLGRHFATNLESDDGPEVLFMEPGTGEVFCIPGTALDFHNKHLIETPDNCLAVPFWNEWRAKNPEPLGFSECIGYKVPLFLGGEDDLPNLERTDLEVYLEVCSQLLQETRGLPDGTRLRNTGFSE